MVALRRIRKGVVGGTLGFGCGIMAPISACSVTGYVVGLKVGRTLGVTNEVKIGIKCGVVGFLIGTMVEGAILTTFGGPIFLVGTGLTGLTLGATLSMIDQN